MPPNMRSLIAQVCRNSRSIGYRYSQQARDFSSSHPGNSSLGVTFPFRSLGLEICIRRKIFVQSKKGAFFYITRGLAAVAGYGILGPLLFDAQTAEREKYMKEYEEYLDREEKMISFLEKS